MALQRFEQRVGRECAVLQKLGFEPDEHRAMRRGQVAERGVVFLRQVFEKVHVRDQQPDGLVFTFSYSVARHGGLRRRVGVLAPAFFHGPLPLLPLPGVQGFFWNDDG